MHRPIFPQILHNGRRMVFSQCQRRTVATSGACGGCHARSQQMRRGGKKVRTLPRVHHGWSGCTEGRRVGKREREREARGIHSFPHSLRGPLHAWRLEREISSPVCPSVRRSVGGMGSQSQKLSMSALDARTRGLRNVATLPKCLFARPRLSDRGNMHSLHWSNNEAQCQADMG